MERYCVLKNLKSQKECKWNFQEGYRFWDIYLQILNKYYCPKSIQEQFRISHGNSNYSEFWRLKSLENEKIWCTVSNAATNMSKSFEMERGSIDSGIIELMNDWRFQAEPDVMLKRNDNVYEDIVRDVICRRTSFFYLDIWLSFC